MKLLVTGLLLMINILLTAQCPTLVWQDEFEGNALDQNKWSHQTGDGCDISLCGWGNNEQQYYRQENTSVSGGTLKIIAKKESFGGKQYTSSRIRTIYKGEIKYGRIEARVKLPIGQGIWPAFWMLPTDNIYGIWPKSGEIDILEYLGHEPNTIYATLHYGEVWPNNKSTTGKYILPEGGLNDDFHTIAMEWSSDKIEWFIDGYLFTKKTKNDITGNWPFDQRFHLLLNMAVGGNWPGNPNFSTVFPQVYEIDYVRVYDMTGQPYLSGQSTVTQATQGLQYSIDRPRAGSNYAWSLPTDASIVSGQGTSSIVTNWGGKSGYVKVTESNNCGTYEYKLYVKAEGSLQKKVSLENFDEEAKITKGFSSGTYTDEILNANQNTINSSAKCGEYKRSGNSQYDVLFYSAGTALGNVSKMVSGEEKFFIDIYSTAPIGTQLLLQLENSSSASSSNYPTGRHSRYTVTTTKKDEWERLELKFLDRPDASVSHTSVNTIVLLFAPNTFTDHTFRIDNFDIYHKPPLATGGIVIHTLKAYPNPAAHVLQVTSPVALKSCVIYDAIGRLVADRIVSPLEEGIYSIDLKDVNSGFYFIKATGADGSVVSGSFVKE